MAKENDCMMNNSKKALAVIAVALMLGCGFVPLFAGNTSAAEATTAATDDGSEGFTISDLIEIVKSLKEGAESIELNDSLTLVPVEDSGEASTSVGPSIVGRQEVTGEEILSGTVTFTAKDGVPGVIVVKNGGTLELFPLDSEYGGFTLVNNNDASLECHDGLIAFESGSKLKIFGTTLMIVSHGKSTGIADQPHLFMLNAGGSVTFKYEYVPENNDVETGSITLEMTLSDKSELRIFGKLAFDYISDEAALSIKGKITQKENGFTFTDGVFVINSGHGYSKYNYSFSDVTLDVVNKAVVSGSKVTQEFSVSLSMDIDSLYYYVKDKKIEISIGDDKVANAKKSTLTAAFNGKVELTVDGNFIPTEKTISINANKIELNVTDGYVKTEKIKLRDITDATITVSNLSLKTKMVWDDTMGQWETASSYLNIGLNVEASELYLGVGKLSNERIFGTMRLTDFKLSIPAIVVNMSDDGSMSVTMDSATVVSNAEWGMRLKSENGKSTSVFSFDVSASITGFSFTSNADGMNLGANAAVNVHKFYDGLDRNLTLKFDGVYGSMVGLEINAGVNHIQFVNTIPFKTILKSFTYKLMDDFNVDLNVYNLKLDLSQGAIVGDQLTILYKNFGNTSEVYMELNNNVTMPINIPSDESTAPIFSCESVSGYVKDIGGEKETFTISSISTFKPVVLSILGMNTNPVLFTINIMQGDAVFGKGTLPVNLVVGANAKFHAEGLSAYMFVFQDGCTTSGYVTIDTSDGMYQLWSTGNEMTVVNRSVTFFHSVDKYDIFEVCQYIESESYTSAGYTYKLDLTTMKSTVTANDGYTLPSVEVLKETVYGVQNVNLVSGKTMTFDFDFTENYGAVGFKCVGDKYWLRYEGHSDFNKMCKYGDAVNLEFMTGSTKFVGWKDVATGDIYAFDETLGTSFVMPARDVTLVEVLVEEGNVNKHGTTATIDTGNNDVTSINAEDIEKYPEVKTVEIISNTANVSMDIGTFKAISEYADGKIYVNCNVVKTTGDATVDSTLVGKVAYSITITDAHANPVYYTNETEFEVTAKGISADQGLTGFKAYYVDEYGHYQEVGVKSYTKNSDGTYDVVFTVNHFSTFAIEPTYTDYGNIPALVISVGFIVLLLAGIYALYNRANKH